jgi:SAM-dependent methyltransferase
MIDEIYPNINEKPLMKRLMKLFFVLLYHPLAWSYDLVASAVSFGQWKTWVLSAAELVQGPEVLELGYGPGHLLLHLTRVGHSVYGIDESKQMAKQASHRLSKKKLPVHLTRGLGQALPFPSERFDTVVATFPAEYIILPATLNEIKRVLKPGGRFVVLFTAWISGESLPEKTLGLIYQVTGQAPEKTPEEGLNLPEKFELGGMQAKTILRQLPRGKLLFVVAEKPQR